MLNIDGALIKIDEHQYTIYYSCHLAGSRVVCVAKAIKINGLQSPTSTSEASVY